MVGCPAAAAIDRSDLPDRSSCPEDIPADAKSLLAAAIAIGMSVSVWAKNNGVPRRTAFYWASQPKVRDAVERFRRRALDRAVGRMTSRVVKAVNGIHELSQVANSESVRLAALRATVSVMIAVSKFSALEDRVARVEEKFRAQSRTTYRVR